MKNLNPPQLDSLNVYKRVKKNARDADKKLRLENIEHLVLSRYEIYESNATTLEVMTDSNIIDENDIKALGSCYNRNKDGYLEGEVVAEIIALQSSQHKNSCPYCGMDKPRTIDHYLPKSIYPEFSIYPPNLIPCCGHCNGKKSFKWLNNGKRLFLNFYYDDIPNEKFLNVELIFDSNPLIQEPRVVFELKNNSGIGPEQFSLITSHYKELGLLNELSEYVEEELSNLHDEILHNTHLPREEHIESLRRKKDSFVRKYGQNYWKSSLYEAIIESDEFFERIYKLRVS
ncbi:HNH endonuclease [Paenibacillus sp. FSL K6-2524]|uniref:HNH endonuclease n=1 Tax=Paenibacillus sp. FSL K6-2524 TaxID=2954516 RepID=UPI0030FCFE83